MFFVLYNIVDKHYYHDTEYVSYTVENASQYHISVVAQEMADILNRESKKVEWIVVPISDSYFDALV